MPNSNYRGGRALEYAVMRQLKEQGLTCLRTAGSHGMADVVVFNLEDLWPGNPAKLRETIGETFGGMALPMSQVINDFLYAKQRVTASEKYEETIHFTPVTGFLIQCKRKRRKV